MLEGCRGVFTGQRGCSQREPESKMGLARCQRRPLRPVRSRSGASEKEKKLAPDLRRQLSNVTLSPCSGNGMSDRWLSLLTSGTTMRWPRTVRASFLASRRETCRVMVPGPTSGSRCSAGGWRRVRRLSTLFARELNKGHLEKQEEASARPLHPSIPQFRLFPWLSRPTLSPSAGVVYLVEFA